MRDIAKKDRRFTVHEVDADRVIVVRNTDEVLIADLGALPEKDYYWIAFSLMEEGYYLLRKAFIHQPVDQKESLN